MIVRNRILSLWSSGVEIQKLLLYAICVVLFIFHRVLNKVSHLIILTVEKNVFVATYFKHSER